MRFAKIKATCLACRAPLKDTRLSSSLCEHCAPREAEVYARTLNCVNELEEQYGGCSVTDQGAA